MAVPSVHQSADMVRARSLRARLNRRALGATRRISLRHAAPSTSLRLEKIGSDYGGWIVPTRGHRRALGRATAAASARTSRSTWASSERFGCTVSRLRPDAAGDRVRRRAGGDEPRFDFHPVGLWSEDTTLRFFAPRDPAHVSHSVVNLQRTEEYFEAPCRSVPSLMHELGHDRIDLLKLDIEGAEHRVIESMLAAGIRPVVLCIGDRPAGETGDAVEDGAPNPGGGLRPGRGRSLEPDLPAIRRADPLDLEGPR